MRSRSLPRLHLLTDDRVLSSPNFLRQVESIAAEVERRSAKDRAEGREVALHLRGPRTSGRRLWEVGVSLLAHCRGAGIPLFVNDRVDLALVLRAEGSHLGGRSLPPEEARRLLGTGGILGASVHSRAEAEKVLSRRAVPGGGGSPALPSEGIGLVDYLFAGSAFPTLSHPGRTPLGVAGLKEVVEGSGGVSVLAIGGIDPDRAEKVLATGVYGVALLRWIWDAKDPGERVAILLDRIGAALQPSEIA